MKKIDMGCYYSSDRGLVRTVTKALDEKTKKVMIVFVKIEAGGCASFPCITSEEEFATYIK